MFIFRKFKNNAARSGIIKLSLILDTKTEILTLKILFVTEEINYDCSHDVTIF